MRTLASLAAARAGAESQLDSSDIRVTSAVMAALTFLDLCSRAMLPGAAPGVMAGADDRQIVV